MASNPWTFSPVGVDAMTGGYFAGGVMSADVPHFHPSVLLEHAGFGFGLGDAAVNGGGGAATAPDLGGNFAASNVTLASFASQLFATAPAPLEEVMDGGYGVAGGGSCGQSEAMAVWPSPSFKKPAGTWSSAGGSRATSVHEPYYHLAGLPDAAGLHYQLAAAAAAADAPASSELSLTLCSKTSSGSALHAAADQCSSAASRSALTELPPALYPRARPATIRPAHFAVVVARSSRYAAVSQGLLNDAVGRLLDGVAGAAAADSCGGSAGAPSVVSSNSNRLMAASSDDGGAAQSAKSDLLKMLQLIDEKYNQCLDEIQSTTAKFNTLMHSGGGGGGVSICTPFAHRAVSAVYRGLRRRIAGEIMAASGPTCWGESSSSVTVTAAGDAERSWESAFIQKHWAAQQLRRGEQQCWRPQRGLPEKSVAVLKAWMFANFLHPYPKDNEKDVLAARSGLTRNQVSNWFINARVRLWKPMIEEMYQDLKKGSGVGGDGAFAVGQAMEQHTSKRRICELADGQ